MTYQHRQRETMSSTFALSVFLQPLSSKLYIKLAKFRQILPDTNVFCLYVVCRGNYKRTMFQCYGVIVFLDEEEKNTKGFRILGYLPGQYTVLYPQKGSQSIVKIFFFKHSIKTA